MLVAMAAAMHWLEGTMPPLFAGMPGVKLGLANVFTLFALQTLGKGEALLVSVLRCGLGLLLTGAPVGTLVCFMLVSVMELIAIKRVTPHPPKYLRVFVKPVLAAAIMGAAARAAYGILAGHLGNTMSVAGGIVVGAIVYAILVLVLRIVSKDDLSLMPKGDKIAKLLHIK